MQEEINQIGLNAITRWIGSYTYRLLDMTDQSSGGTAISIKINGRYFFATAAHVIKSNHEYNMLPHNKEGQLLRNFINKEFNLDTDVGLLEIDKNEISLIENWLDISEIYEEIDHQQEYPVIVKGYPGEMNKTLLKEKISKNWFIEFQRLDSLSFQSQTLPIQKWPKQIEEIIPTPENDLFVDYYPEDFIYFCPPDTVNMSKDKTKKCPAFYGMSGGGIWLLENTTEGQIFIPKAKLIGIQHHVSEKGQWIRGSLVKCWLNLAKEKYNDIGL